MNKENFELLQEILEIEGTEKVILSALQIALEKDSGLDYFSKTPILSMIEHQKNGAMVAEMTSVLIKQLLQEIWYKEFQAGYIKPHTLDEFKEKNFQISSEEVWKGNIPSAISAQLVLLRFLTTLRNDERMAKYISQTVYDQLANLRDYSNSGRHAKERKIFWNESQITLVILNSYLTTKSVFTELKEK